MASNKTEGRLSVPSLCVRPVDFRHVPEVRTVRPQRLVCDDRRLFVVRLVRLGVVFGEPDALIMELREIAVQTLQRHELRIVAGAECCDTERILRREPSVDRRDPSEQVASASASFGWDERGTKDVVKHVHDDGVPGHLVLICARHAAGGNRIDVLFVNAHKSEALAFRELSDERNAPFPVDLECLQVFNFHIFRFLS